MINTEEILNLPANELDNLMNEIRKRSKQNKEKELVEQVEKHSNLIGKCFKMKVKPHLHKFPEMWRYYKIINVRSKDEYTVSALRFDEYPTYWFDYQKSKINNIGDYYFGKYLFDGVVIDEDFPIYFYDLQLKEKDGIFSSKIVEIDVTEYNKAMNLFIDRLQKMEWPADHFRYGDKLPGDVGWENKF